MLSSGHLSSINCVRLAHLASLLFSRISMISFWKGLFCTWISFTAAVGPSLLEGSQAMWLILWKCKTPLHRWIDNFFINFHQSYVKMFGQSHCKETSWIHKEEKMGTPRVDSWLAPMSAELWAKQVAFSKIFCSLECVFFLSKFQECHCVHIPLTARSSLLCVCYCLSMVASCIHWAAGNRTLGIGIAALRTGFPSGNYFCSAKSNNKGLSVGDF